MQPNLKKNYLYSVFYEVLKLITPFITTPYLARVLEADGVGAYSFTHSNITYFMLFAALGTASYGAREIARNRDNRRLTSKLFWEIELMTVFTTLISLLAWGIFILLSTEYRWHYIALTPFLLSTMFDISWFYRGLEEIRSIVVRNTVVRIASIILFFLLVKRKEDILIYCAINSVTMMLGSLSMWTILPGKLDRVPFRELRFRNHFRETLIYFIPTIATSIYTVLDKTLIGAITGNTYENGYYEEATKVINIAKAVVFVAVNSIMEARMSYLFAENKIDEIKKRIAQSMNFIYLLAIGAVFGIVGIAECFVPIFLGNGYGPVVILLYCMSPLILIVGTSNCLGAQYYTPSGQRKRSAKVIVLGAVVNLCLNLLLIPGYGVYGATVASVFAELVITVIYVQMSAGYIRWRQIWSFAWKRVLAGSIMCIVLYGIGLLLKPMVVDVSGGLKLMNVGILLIQICTGLVVYGVLLQIMKDDMLKKTLGVGRRKINQLLRK